MKKNGQTLHPVSQSASARSNKSPARVNFTGNLSLVLLVLLQTHVNAAQLTGKALLASDQKTAAPGVWVTLTYNIGDKVKQDTIITGADGSYTMEIPEGAVSPVTVHYSKAGQTIIVDSPPPLSDAELKSNKPMPSVFVHPTDEMDTLNVKALTIIFEQRGEDLRSPEQKKMRILEDAKVLKEANNINERVLIEATNAAIEEV